MYPVKDIRIPGLIWTLLIAILIVAIETYMPAEYQLYGEAAVVALFGIAKAANLGTQQLEELIAILRTVQATQPQTRGLLTDEGVVVTPALAAEEYEPNKLVRWLAG
jgi:hypothetical protein